MFKRASGSSQRVVRRNRFYVLAPSLILIVVLLILIWEVVRVNLPHRFRLEFPFTATILGVAPAASLVGALGGLLLVRGQFARSVRPAIGWTGGWMDLQPAGGRDDNVAATMNWIVKVFNGGSGLGVVHDAEYLVVERGKNAHFTAAEKWVSLEEVVQLLEAAGLMPGSDFVLFLLGRGFPLPPSTNPADGFHLATLSDRAVRALENLDMRLRVSDSLGDIHERHLQLLAGAEAERHHHPALLSPLTGEVIDSGAGDKRPLPP